MLVRAKVAQDEPSREDGHSPESEVEVGATDLGKKIERGQTVADGLPGRLGTTQEGREVDNVLLGDGQVCDDEVEEQVVDLEADGEEDVDGEAGTEAVAGPVKRGLVVAVAGDEDGEPCPPGALGDDDGPEGGACAGAQGDVVAVEVVTDDVAGDDGDDAGQERAQRTRADGEPHVEVREVDSLGKDGLADPQDDKQEVLGGEELQRPLDLLPGVLRQVEVGPCVRRGAPPVRGG